MKIRCPGCNAVEDLQRTTSRVCPDCAAQRRDVVVEFEEVMAVDIEFDDRQDTIWQLSSKVKSLEEDLANALALLSQNQRAHNDLKGDYAVLKLNSNTNLASLKGMMAVGRAASDFLESAGFHGDSLMDRVKAAVYGNFERGEDPFTGPLWVSDIDSLEWAPVDTHDVLAGGWFIADDDHGACAFFPDHGAALYVQAALRVYRDVKGEDE